MPVVLFEQIFFVEDTVYQICIVAQIIAERWIYNFQDCSYAFFNSSYIPMLKLTHLHNVIFGVLHYVIFEALFCIKCASRNESGSDFFLNIKNMGQEIWTCIISINSCTTIESRFKILRVVTMNLCTTTGSRPLECATSVRECRNTAANQFLDYFRKYLQRLF